MHIKWAFSMRAVPYRGMSEHLGAGVESVSDITRLLIAQPGPRSGMLGISIEHQLLYGVARRFLDRQRGTASKSFLQSCTPGDGSQFV